MAFRDHMIRIRRTELLYGDYVGRRTDNGELFCLHGDRKETNSMA
jgi:hypothetical protein